MKLYVVKVEHFEGQDWVRDSLTVQAVDGAEASRIAKLGLIRPRVVSIYEAAPSP